MVKINLPPPSLPVSPVILTLNVGTELRRIYDPTRHNTLATTFRYYGPIGRFDHQRHDLKQPSTDRDRGINYWGFTLSSCLVEVFGDTRIIDTTDREVALIELTQEIKLLDIRSNGAMKAGSVTALAKVADREISQTWSRYFYDNPNIYDRIDGIIYSNAHNDEDAIALYERAEPQLQSAKVVSLPLASNSLRPAIAECAIDNNLIFL